MPLDLQRPRDLGRILDDAFSFYRARWQTLLALSAVVVVPVFLLVLGVGLGWLWEGYDAPPKGTVRLADVADNLVGLAAQLLIVTPLVTAMTVYVVRRAGEGATTSTGEALREGFRVFGPLLAAVLLVGLGVTAGLFFLIIPGLYLAVRWSVVPQVVVIEGRTGGDALQRSMELTRNQGWFAFLVLVVANLIVAVLEQVLLIPLDAAAKSADSQALDLVGQLLGALLTLPLVAVAQTLLYYALVAAKGGAGAVAPSPAPPPTAPPQTLPGVPGTFGDGFAPPRPPSSE